MGSFSVSADPEIVLTTTLGSCVAVCLHDEHAGCGGMNHFLLPNGNANRREGWGVPERYGCFAIESLVNALINAGCERGRLSAKVFGGARMIASSVDVGGANAAFALDYLEREGIPVLATDLGGVQGRVVRLHPTSGRTMRRLVRERTVLDAEARLSQELHREAEKGGTVELF